MITGKDHADEPGRINFRRTVASILMVPLLLGLLIFLPAGTWAWARGWLFFVVFLLAMAALALYLWRVNPEIFVARSRIHEGTKGWDRILLAALFPALLAIFPVAALDDGRYHWSHVPWWVCAIGYALTLVGMAVTAWAQAVNRFFEPGVRIQADRGHTVIQTGPYAVVRHPGYTGACLLFVGTALALGSLWALIPAILACLILVVRTAWEDRTLREELPGYKEYTQRVRYRLIPGVW
jgi:protein-S-isoprenylcysteine O-methyltransferase Ste14